MTHRLSPQAARELDDIWLYTATESGSRDIADRLVDRFTRAFLLLAQQPYIGRARDYDLRAGMRSFPVGDYIIIYRLRKDDLVIVSIVRGSRDYPSIFN